MDTGVRFRRFRFWSSKGLETHKDFHSHSHPVRRLFQKHITESERSNEENDAKEEERIAMTFVQSMNSYL